ncbi:MAG: hypothetical protein WD065_19330 [Planctomycetaceae bacterium]
MTTLFRIRRRILAASLGLLLIPCFSFLSSWNSGGPRMASSAGAAEKKQSQKKKANKSAEEGTPRDFQSPHFIVHTDLAAEDAEDLLKRLETMVKLLSGYWGRPCRQTIECYVVKDLANWPKDAFPGRAIESLEAGGGVTMTTVVSNGNDFQAKSTVYAVADRGTPQHEAVHAFCGQTFGSTGPTWYSEGMAEMGNYWRESDHSVNCDEIVIRYIRESEPKTLNEIVNSDEQTGDSWQNYAWRWALCHLLEHNPNYRERFRPLGLGLLTGQKVSFEQVYGSMADEISFEYLFFLNNLEAGYRVDLCAWDWKPKFRTLKGTRTQNVKVLAAKGWQPTRVEVDDESAYVCQAAGEWSIDAEGKMLTADGNDDGAGKLIGIVMDDYKLSGEFELGAETTFTAPKSGQLYVRCRDGWGSVADNKGQLAVKIKLAGK